MTCQFERFPALVLKIAFAFQASDEFRDWNRWNPVCYTTELKQLTYFRNYSRDSCLLECKMKKAAVTCKCQPWYLAAGKFNASKNLGKIVGSCDFVV